MKNLFKMLENETKEYLEPNKLLKWPPIWTYMLIFSTGTAIIGMIIESKGYDWGLLCLTPLFITAFLCFYLTRKIEWSKNE